MNWFQQIMESIGQLLRWWFIVLPWEQALRVRLGNRIVLFESGLHFQVPFIDRVYIQNIRRRIAPIRIQTITTQDGKTVTLAGSLSYKITDIEKLYRTLHQAESTIMQSVQGIVSDFVVRNDLAQCTPRKVAENVTERLNLDRYGLGETEFFLTDFAIVRTYRLLQDELTRWAGAELMTTQAISQDVPR